MLINLSISSILIFQSPSLLKCISNRNKKTAHVGEGTKLWGSQHSEFRENNKSTMIGSCNKKEEENAGTGWCRKLANKGQRIVERKNVLGNKH